MTLSSDQKKMQHDEVIDLGPVYESQDGKMVLSERTMERVRVVEEHAKNLVRAIAMDVGKAVAHHIETMYPEAVISAPSTMLLSVRNCTYNNIMAAIESEIPAEIRLKAHDKHRRKVRAAYKNIGINIFD